MAATYKNLFTFIIFTVSLYTVNSIKRNGGITLNLHHRDSVLLNPSTNIDRFSLLRNAFHRSFSRQKALSRAASLSSNSKSLDSLGSTLTSVGGEYLMKIKIGTPPVETLAIADTGSDLTWTQCLPCKECYKQTSPYFDPNKTSTYRQLSCSSVLCTACTASNLCSYSVSYGDGSYSKGDLSSDSFTFDSDGSDEALTIPNIVFGCGHDNGGIFDSRGSGIVGLGAGDVSMIRQLNKYIKGKFSYCLTHLNSNASSKISFGTNAIISGPNVVSTPLVQNAGSRTFYYVTLEGISIGDKTFSLHSSSDGDGDGDDDGNGDDVALSFERRDIILDSGTTLTFLPQSLYDSVESELANSTKGTRVDDPQGMFGLCYDASSVGQIDEPHIVAHFTGADVALPRGSVFVLVGKGMLCLTLVATQQLSIFGNLHQMNYHVGYDLVNQKVDFLPTDCSKLH